jgi:hypothetical protein
MVRTTRTKKSKRTKKGSEPRVGLTSVGGTLNAARKTPLTSRSVFTRSF